MRRKSLLLAAGITVLCTAARAESVATTSASPLRSHRRISIATGGDCYFDGSSVVPMPNLKLSVNLWPHLAVEGKVASLLFATVGVGGLKGYLLPNNISPYAYARMGVVHVAFLDSSTTALFNAGAGVEVASDNGLLSSAELGVTLLGLDDPQAVGQTSLAFGYRF